MKKLRVTGFVSCRLWSVRLLLGILALTVSSEPGWAQVAATISGRVEDASGAAVTGATVTAKSVETGGTRVVTTE